MNTNQLKKGSDTINCSICNKNRTKYYIIPDNNNMYCSDCMINFLQQDLESIGITIFVINNKELKERNKITPKLRFQILNRDNFTCKSCGRTSPNVILEVDHVIPISKGGKSIESNLITLCSECNIGKGDSLYG